MMHDPWTLLGWMLAAIVAFAIITAPIGFILLVRLRQRMVREHDASRASFFEASRRARAELNPTRRTRGV